MSNAKPNCRHCDGTGFVNELGHCGKVECVCFDTRTLTEAEYEAATRPRTVLPMLKAWQKQYGKAVA